NLARVHGFTDAELELAKKTILSGAEQSARGEATVPSTARVMAMNQAVTMGRKPMSRSQRKELIAKLLPSITGKEVLESFRATYPLDRGLVMAALPEKDGVAVPTKEDLLAAAKAAAAADIAKPAEEKRADTILEKEPEPAAITAQSEDKDLGVLSVTFANGVRVHLRTMDVRKDSVMLQLRFMGGPIDETVETSQLSMVGALALQPRTAASKRHSSTAISDLLTGKKYQFGGAPVDGALAFQLAGSPEDLQDGFRMMHLLLTEPVIEKAALDRWRQQFTMMLPNFEKNAGFKAGQAVNELLSGGDPRLAFPAAERIQSIRLEDAQAWLERILNTAPVEAAIVGDMPRDKMLDLARRYLGTLPKRPLVRDDLAEKRKVKQNAGPFTKKIEVDTITPRAEVRLGWRGPAYANRADRRVLLFASQILSTRLLNEIREKRGLTYSLGCLMQPAPFDGMAQLMIQFTADPEKADEAAKVARQVALEFVEKAPPTDDEMAAVRRQLANILSTQLQQPRFWAQTMSTLLTNGRTLAQVKRIEEDYLSVTREQIAATLKRYFKEYRFYSVIAAPKKK
ncbi:MAG: M16 family metallopeptidase, partial [Planctomycetota bacterium]